MSENNTSTLKKVALSARAIEKMKPETFKADIGENEGLRVVKGKTGLTSFIYRYRSPIDNSQKKMKIGTFPEMSLADARVELHKLKVIRRSGICPSAQAKELKIQKKNDALLEKAECFTIKEMVDLYLINVIEDRYVEDVKTGQKKLIRGARKLKGQDEARRTIYGDAVRVLGDYDAMNVTRKDVVNMILKIVERGANVQAGRVLSELTLAYEYAIGLEKFSDNFANPALLAKASIKQMRIKLTCNQGKRVLTDNELKRVLTWLPNSGFSKSHIHILQLSLWTACRTGEACNARWKDIDFLNKTWHIREAKNGAERYVQLSIQCIEYLKSIHIEGQEYIFLSSRSGKPILQKTLTEAKWRLKNPDKVVHQQRFRPEQLWLTDMPDWNPHDLRRTVRTSLSRLGCPTDIAEAILGHSKKGIEGTYNLHKYENECAEWLQKWADHLDAL